ncbi:MAG: glycosyltransferase, partial [Anaplasmataceae bacterium]|nr:glycosyltransferase [Anaplasmataceae bacterium]
NQELMGLIDDCKDRFSLLGERDDMPEIFSSANIIVNTSSSEALSLAMLEAMACGCVPCVTPVGDAEHVLQDMIGILTKVDDVDSIVVGMKNALSKVPVKDGKVLTEGRDSDDNPYRSRIVKDYSLDRMAKKFDNLLQESMRPPSRLTTGAQSVKQLVAQHDAKNTGQLTSPTYGGVNKW